MVLLCASLITPISSLSGCRRDNDCRGEGLRRMEISLYGGSIHPKHLSRSAVLEDCSICPTQTGTSFMVSRAGVVYPGSQLPFSLACCQSLMHCASWASVNDSFWVCPLHVLLHLSCVPIRSILMWSCYGLATSSSRKKFTWLSKFLASPISPIFWVSYIKPLVSTGEAQRHK